MAPENNQPGPSRRNVWRMFDQIAGTYDLVNRLLSMRRDVVWRRKMAGMLPPGKALRVLDLATGTCDVLLALRRHAPSVAGGAGADMSGGMLRGGQRKLAAAGLAGMFPLVRSDATRLAFADGVFDAVTIAFGIRNVVDTDAALGEMLRVLKPGGRALILEFSLPSNALFRAVYLFYFRHVLPRLGGLVSGKPVAYRYLNETVEAFPYGEAFCALMARAGFERVSAKPLTFGIATLYTGDRPVGA